MKWETKSSKVIYKNRYMTVTEDVVMTGHGDQVTYGIVHKQPFSIIIPWDGTRMLLVGQHRHFIKYFSWEFPMGHAESDAPDFAAKRELEEETGLSARAINEIAQFYPAPGTMDQVGYIYVATDWTEGRMERELSEKDMQMKWVTLEEMNNLIKDGVIKDGPTIVSLKYFEMYLLTH